MADRRAAAGPSWVELSVALTALVASFGSLYVARHQSEVMDRQLAASVWPLLEYDTGNVGDDGRPRLSLGLRNSGVGPTRVRSVRVSYEGRPVRDAGELLRTCCAAAIDTARVCYCSVLDDCWVMDTRAEGAEPAPVRSCAEERRAPQYR